MRRMITNKGVVDLVNKAVESGEIEIPLYRHDIVIGDSNYGYASLVILNDNSTPINSEALLIAYLNNNNFTSPNAILTIYNSGHADAETGDIIFFYGFYVKEDEDSGDLVIMRRDYYSGDVAASISSITDKVTLL